MNLQAKFLDLDRAFHLIAGPIENMANEQPDLGIDLDLIKEGNELAFRQLHDEYSLPLFYFTNALINNPQETKEIVSEIFMKFWQLRQNFETIKSVKAFLYVSCRNAGYDFLRHLKTKKAKLEVPLACNSNDIDNSDEHTVLHQIIQTELIKQIHQEIEKLPPQRRAVLKMLYVDGLKTDEVARRLDLAPENVRVTKSQALQQLRNQIIDKKIIGVIAVLLL